MTVGRGVNTYYNPVHGITLHVPEDSLPQHMEKVEVTIKVGFTEHQLDSDMIMCSATVALQSVPQVLFTKDVFLEIPHSFSSTDTSDLWFIKFKDDIDEMTYGEIHRGIFPPEHPYGVVLIRSFSSYMIVKGKRYFRPLRKIHLCQSKRLFYKVLQSKHLRKHKSTNEEFADKSYANSFWFGIKKISTKNEDYNTFLFSVAQYTPTGFQAVKQYTSEQAWDHWLSFNFSSDKLVFHPQVADDCGWKACCEGSYEVKKQEAERLCDSHELRIPVVQYILTPTQPQLQIPGVTVVVSGANKKLSYMLTAGLPPSQESINQPEMLHTLSRLSVEPNDFLQQLAYRLPVWKPVAQMLGLTESDIDHIDYDVLSSFPGEKAYQAFLRWMQKEGHYGATYDVLLLALCRATNISDCKSITNAWWYADRYLNKLSEQSIES
ncbi:uncharacterized protein [Dysidea avara]|uniref:uncharacterized protein n=1 Tax=Dysidea avara TaxID=196820 RepID=UPI003324FACC